jgi:hypothetical protein
MKLGFKLFAALFISLLLHLFVSYEVYAQETYTIRVLVNASDDGAPLIGATVILFDIENEQEIRYGGNTDSNGLYEFKGIEGDNYILKISYVGYETYVEAMTVRGGNFIRIKRVTLQAGVGELDNVTIAAEREVTTGDAGLIKISTEDLSRVTSPSGEGDLASYLLNIPGIISSGDQGGELYIQGGTPSENMVLVDNLHIVKPFHISTLFSAFPENTIQNVDLYSGGFSTKHMGSTSSVIDVHLRPGNFRSYAGSGSVSPYLTSFLIEGPIITDKRSFLVMGRKSLINQTAPILSSDNKPINFYDVTARYTLQEDGYNCNITGIRTFDEGQIQPERNINLKWDNTVLGARCTGFDTQFENIFDITIGFSSFGNSQRSSGSDFRSARFNQFFFKTNTRDQLWDMSVDYGLELNISSYQTNLNDRFTNAESFSRTLPIIKGYISGEWNPNRYFTIQPSFGTMASMVTNPTFEPRLRISFQPDGTNKQELSIAAGQYAQLSNGISDELDAGTVFMYIKPDERHTPNQTARHLIAEYRQELGTYYTGSIQGYLKNYSNIPISRFSPISRLEIETIRADGQAYGVELLQEFESNLFYFSLGYGYAIVEYKATDRALGSYLNEPVLSYNPSHDQRHKVNVVGSFSFAGFTTSLQWEFGTGKPYTKVYGFDLKLDLPDQSPLTETGTAQTYYSYPYDGRLPTYHRLDASIKRSIALQRQRTLKLQAGVINLYDRENIFFYDSSTLKRVNQTSLFPYMSIKANF